MSAVAAPESPTTTTDPSRPETQAEKANAETWAVERSRIDASASGAVLTFFFVALAWLLVATIYGFISSLKLSYPGFLSDTAVLTYGRVVPAFTLSFNYGWASMAGMGVAIWLMARLCRVPIRFPGFLIVGAIFWNFGLVLAVVGVLIGKNTGLESMPLPRPAAWMMFIGYLFIGMWGAILYRQRTHRSVFISVWYLLGAFFWFPWLFFTANVLVGLPQIQGVMQNVVSVWFAHGLQHYWFTAIGLATAYYLIPKVTNRPIYSYNLASIGFWTWAVFGGMTALTKLSGGPVPAWLVTISIAASIMMIVPLATIGTNIIKTMQGVQHMVYHSPTIRFTFFGSICFCLALGLSVLTSLRSVDGVLHFTLYQAAYNELLLYSFYSMVMFGAIYYITPRLVGCEWLSASLIKMHFLGSAYGGGMAVACLFLAGIAAGMGMSDPENTFSQIVQFGQFYLPGRIIALVLVSLGHTVFGLHFLLMLLRIGQPAGQATLFAPLAKKEAH